MALNGLMDTVGTRASEAHDHGSELASNGAELSGLLGTATDVSSAFQDLWSERAETAMKAAAYVENCSQIVRQAAAAIVEGDQDMTQHGEASDARVSGPTMAWGEQA